LISNIIRYVLEAYVVIIFARIILSYFPTTPGSGLARVAQLLNKLTEPVLGPLRKILPPMGIGGVGLDLSPLIVLIVIQVVLIPLFAR